VGVYPSYIYSVDSVVSRKKQKDNQLDSKLYLHFLRIAEDAALACAPSIGQGDRKESDRLAVEAMRHTMQSVPMAGTIVIGEGERDEAPMLFIGEQVGLGGEKIDIAVDPLEGTNLCAENLPNAITVLAAAPEKGLLHAPDLYMEKLVVGPACKGRVNLEWSVEKNLKAMSQALDLPLSELQITVLDRPRHQSLIESIRRSGTRVHLISDGDLSACLLAALEGSGIHGVMGTGGAPEGVLAAAALKCLGGEIQGRLVTDHNTASQSSAEQMGAEFNKIYLTDDLAPGSEIIFAASGVTSGDLVQGVTLQGTAREVYSVLLTTGQTGLRYYKSTLTLEGTRTTLAL